MEFMSAREAADKWGISQRRVAVLCSENRIDNATMVGNMWIIPTTAEKPIDARSVRYRKCDSKKTKPFLKWAGGKGQLLSEIEKYYPFGDGKIIKYAEKIHIEKQNKIRSKKIFLLRILMFICQNICGALPMRI